ncbi:hypothetical protein SKAU_G00070930 [Synaphobranchus kaupii]|uniref:Uncharacterized protein n=1 Tax=Synaphobranchus kaupii TaxID=118154 RepID=A0A9Q1G7M0_SYNKA|nr:hypothetical protein SKAU_G00070930 [Synaphobranchus kaupii]
MTQEIVLHKQTSAGDHRGSVKTAKSNSIKYSQNLTDVTSEQIMSLNQKQQPKEKKNNMTAESKIFC